LPRRPPSRSAPATPLRAKKARYFEDRRFTERVLPPPKPGSPAPIAPDEWSSLPLRRPPEAQAAEADNGDDTANSGLRREPELPEHVAIAPETAAPPPAREFDVADDTDDSIALQARALSQRMRSIARQAALDPDDGLGL
jgi:type IV secretion system protein VirD4